jgi:tetratricopeptide (TPR) repeat protein
MRRSLVGALALAACCLAAVGLVGWAQPHHGEAPALPKEFSEPMPLIPKALGAFTRPISSTNAEAQAYFNQGFQLMYAFGKPQAERSFREAEKRDPACAICYWGEAWSWGSYLNGPMEPQEAPFAYAAIQKAISLAPAHANATERALINAMSVRYVANFDPAKRHDQDSAYAEAMRKVHEQFPQDLDIATLYADSLFIMEPRWGWRDIHTPNVQRIKGVLEGVLAIDPQHVGACHLYIHLTEATTEPALAEPCADTLGHAIPGASHINHMPSHTWNRLGRWGDSVRASLDAWHSDQKAAIGEGFAIYPSHDLMMLLFAASMDGQGAIAIQAGRDLLKLGESDAELALSLIRFGRFDEVFELTRRPRGEIDAGMWDFAQGYAQLRAGHADKAREYLSSVAKSPAMYKGANSTHIVGTLAAILEGEIQRANGHLDQAIASFERAVSLYNALVYDEPEPLPFAAHHWLGAALVEAGRYADAERVYREDLKRHPHNGWSLFGLKAALDAQGNPSASVNQDFESSWARSDTWIRTSAF